MSKNKEYAALLKKQIAKIGKEVRFLEFKSNYQDADRLGKYISALSNGACLNNEEFGYLYFARKNLKIPSVCERFSERFSEQNDVTY